MFENGGGPVILEHVPASPMGLCDGGWHTVSVDKQGNMGSMTVDGGSPVSETGVSAFMAVDIGDTLYVGGTPGISTSCYQ